MYIGNTWIFSRHGGRETREHGSRGVMDSKKGMGNKEGQVWKNSGSKETKEIGMELGTRKKRKKREQRVAGRKLTISATFEAVSNRVGYLEVSMKSFVAR